MSVSAPESLRIPMDMAERLVRWLDLSQNGEARSLANGLRALIAEALDPEQPHHGVETQPPNTMRLHICGTHDRDEPRWQVPAANEIIVDDSGAHYKVIDVRWRGHVADVYTMPVPGWLTREKF